MATFRPARGHIAIVMVGWLTSLIVTGCASAPAGASPRVTDLRPSVPVVTSAPPATAGGMAGANEASPAPAVSPGPFANQQGGGRAMVFDVPLDRLASASEVAVLGRIAAVGPTVLNTPSGQWNPPAGMSADELHLLYAKLGPYTPVEIEITDVLGGRPGGMEVARGDRLDVTLLGGSKTFTLTADEVRRIGLTVPVEAAGSPPARPAPTARPISGPSEVTIRLAPAVRLDQGDVVIAFLTRSTIAIQPGNVPSPVVVAIVPEGWGFYRQTDQADMLVSAGTGAKVTRDALVRAAATLSSLTGDPQPVGGPY